MAPKAKKNDPIEPKKLKPMSEDQKREDDRVKAILASAPDGFRSSHWDLSGIAGKGQSDKTGRGR